MTSDVLVENASVEGTTIATGGIENRRFELEPHNCFACGSLNAHGLQLELHTVGGRCWTELALPNRFEGWEGIAHGGIVCTLLDEVMAWALIDHDAWGLTARLNVDFRRPVKVDSQIRAEGWVTDVRRRLLRTAGRIVDSHSGEELAVGEATYVAASEGRKQELKARYRFRYVSEATEPVSRRPRRGQDGPATPDKVDG